MHTWSWASVYEFFLPTFFMILSCHILPFFLAFFSFTSVSSLFSSCFPPPQTFLCPCLCTLDADRVLRWYFVYFCPPICIYGCKIGVSCARVYFVIWSLRVSIQDWVVKACAPALEANKSPVSMSTHFAPYAYMPGGLRIIEGVMFVHVYIGAEI